MSNSKRFRTAGTPFDSEQLFDNQAYAEPAWDLTPADRFSNDEMTALSLQTISTSQNQQKPGNYSAKTLAVAVSAGWSTEFNNENSFNNRRFDSAVFFRSSYFKRQPQNHLH